MSSLPRPLLLLLILAAGALAGFWALTGADDDSRRRNGAAPDATTSADPLSEWPLRPPIARAPASRGSDPSVGVFWGRVLDAFDRPLRGCRVVCEPAPDKVTVAPRPGAHAAAIRVTEVDGQFELSVAADARDLVFSFDHPDFEPRVAALRRLGPAGTGVHSLGEFVLRSGAGLETVAVDAESGQAVAGAQVRLRPEFVDPTLPPVTLAILERAVATDSRGRAVFGSLPAGSYLLRFESDDHVALERHVRHPLPVPDSAESTRASLVQAELTPSVVLRGRLVSADGDPIPGGILRAHPRDVEFGAATAVEGVSGDTGDFRIPRLARGVHCLTVDTPSHGAQQIPDLVVPAGSPFTIRMGPRSELTGVIREPSPGQRHGHPTGAGTRIELRALASEPILRRKVWVGTTDVDGTFTIGAIPPGRYTARVTSDAPRPGSRLRRVVTIPSQPVNWTLQSTIRLRGQISIDGPAPRPAVSANIRTMPVHSPASPPTADEFSDFIATAGSRENRDDSGNFLARTATTDAAGGFVIEGLDRVPIRLRIDYGTAPAFLSRRLDLRISPGAREFDAGEIRLPWTELVSIRGSVVSSDGAPIPGATVALLPARSATEASPTDRSSPADVATGIADAFGRFTLESVPVGRYLLRGTDTLRADSGSGATIACREIPVELPLDARRPIRLELTPVR